MNRKYKLSTALDVDDILMECTSYAIRLANEKYQFDPPLSIYEKNSWGKIGARIDSIFHQLLHYRRRSLNDLSCSDHIRYITWKYSYIHTLS